MSKRSTQRFDCSSSAARHPTPRRLCPKVTRSLIFGAAFRFSESSFAQECPSLDLTRYYTRFMAPNQFQGVVEGCARWVVAGRKSNLFRRRGDRLLPIHSSSGCFGPGQGPDRVIFALDPGSIWYYGMSFFCEVYEGLCAYWKCIYVETDSSKVTDFDELWNSAQDYEDRAFREFTESCATTSTNEPSSPISRLSSYVASSLSTSPPSSTSWLSLNSSSPSTSPSEYDPGTPSTGIDSFALIGLTVAAGVTCAMGGMMLYNWLQRRRQETRTGTTTEFRLLPLTAVEDDRYFEPDEQSEGAAATSPIQNRPLLPIPETSRKHEEFKSS